MASDRRPRRAAPTRFAALLGPVLAALWLVPLTLPARSAAEGGQSAGRSDAEALAEIETLRSRIETSTLDEAQRGTANAGLDAAASEVREATAVRERIAALKAEAASAAAGPDPVGTAAPHAESGEAADQLALQEWAARIGPDADPETLEDLLDHQRALSAELIEEIEQREAELAQTLARPAESSVEIATLRRRIDELARPLERAEGEAELLFAVRDLRRLQEHHRVEAELALRHAEQETSLARQRQLERVLRETSARRREATLRIAWLQERIAKRSRELLERRVAALAETEKSLAARPSVAATVARENRVLGEELLAETDALAADRASLSTLEPARDRVVTALKDSRTRLELGGASEAVGRWLWSERRSLEPTVRLRRRLENERTELAELRLRRVTLSDARRDLADIPAAAAALLETSQAQAVDEGTVARAGVALEALLRERVELQSRLEPILQRRIRTLEQTEATLQEQIDTSQTLRQLLDRYLLWTPSHGAIDSSWLERVPEGFSDLFKPTRFATTLELAREEIRARPVRWIGSLLLLLGLFELRRRAPAQIREHEAVTRQIGADHIGVTLDAFVWTLVAALPVPAAIALLGSLLQSAGAPGRYSDSVGRACMTLVVPLFAFRTLRFAAIEQGLGHAHLRWMRSRRVALRRMVPFAVSIVTPLYFVSALAFIRNLDLPNDIQARIAIVIACLVLAFVFWRLLDVGQLWVVRGVETEPSNLRKLLRFALPAHFLYVAGLALSGYVYSAGLLLQAGIASLCVVIAVALGVGLIGRWFLVGERRLALRRLEEKLAAASPTSDEGSREPGSADITLEQVNAQTHSVLRMLRIGLLTVGLVWVWAGVLPAITRLDEIVLWTFSEVGADGVTTRQPVSLMGALFGALAFALTVVSSRNLPSLIELGLLSQTSIDAASRYAITSILRYALVIAGTLIGLDLLGMRWSQLQWMAAALTVGLGFGLQEIFANFVSGLILLFERPFRVGDVITVDDLTGRVTRIRTRATTILDFDNREIVVPNKSFITGQLLNWTLSDTTTRVTIKVGVAYGTDADVVHRLLMQAANAHPLVLRDPEPRSWFLAFGASTLDFELRVFVGTLNDRLTVQSDLHREIARLFAENGVEIAFPQMDLNVRDLLGTRTPEAAAAMATAVAGAAAAGETGETGEAPPAPAESPDSPTS